MSNDERLRRIGFRLITRPARGEPTWHHGPTGVTVREAIALAILRCDETFWLRYMHRLRQAETERLLETAGG